MFRLFSPGHCLFGRRALPLSQKIIPTWNDCGTWPVVLLALLGGVFIGLSLLTEQADATWQSGGILVGPSEGQGTLYSVQKQYFKVPGYTYVSPYGLAQMNNGEIIMTAMLGTLTTVTPVETFSTDGGNTWTPFQPMPPVEGVPGMLTYLGGGNLSLSGTSYFSTDYGQTWTIQGTVDQDYTANEGNAAVDRDANGNAIRVMETGYDYQAQYPTSTPVTSFRYSLDKGHTWSTPVTPPQWTFQDTYNGQSYTSATSEGAVVRAANGWLVAALRTDPPSRFAVPGLGDDNLDGTAVSISKDNGQTWSPLNRLYDAGRMHANLQLLPNGDLLMTMIASYDMQFGGGLASILRGEDALISTDNGLTWNSNNLITVDAFSYVDPNAPYDASPCGHIATTVLSDGSALTCYGNQLNSEAVMTKFNPALITSLPVHIVTGDFNRDGKLNSADIVAMLGELTNLSAYRQANTDLSNNDDFLELADVNGDTVVNNADLQALLSLLKSGGGSTSSVPEPASLVLLVAGSVLLLLCRGLQVRKILRDNEHHNLSISSRKLIHEFVDRLSLRDPLN